MMRRLGAGLVGAGLGLLVAWVPGAPAASAASAPASPQSGWWQQANTSPVTAPADPSTPPDGIQVTTGAAGVVAVGAVRFAPPTAGEDGVITLRLASGTATSPSGDLVVHACPATNNWKPVQNGPWSARVTYNETACITGKPSADGKSVSFAVPAATQRGGKFDLGIEALSSAPVSLAFAHPRAADLEMVAPAATSPADSSGSSLGAAPASSPADSASNATTSAPSGTPVQAPVSAATSDASASVGPGLGAPVLAPAAPAKTGGSALVPSTRRFSPVTTVLPPFSDHRGTRIAAVALLLGIGAGLFYFGGQPTRPPRMVGTLGARMAGAGAAPIPPAPMRGIGRFARPREGSLRAREGAVQARS